MNNEFKIGDLVKTIFNTIGRVAKIDSSDRPFLVEDEVSPPYYYTADELELVEES